MANIKFKSTITTENIFKNIKKHNLKTNAVVHGNLYEVELLGDDFLYSLMLPGSPVSALAGMFLGK
jgi:hypothetical protein